MAACAGCGKPISELSEMCSFCYQRECDTVDHFYEDLGDYEYDCWKEDQLNDEWENDGRQ